MKLFFKAESLQKTGSFKVRGAFHSLLRCTREQRLYGVITHSSGNHAASLSYAALTLSVPELPIPAYIIMPENSMPNKMTATRSCGGNITLCGPTSQEREARMLQVQEETGARLIPPYDAVDTIIGQGTVGLEMDRQVRSLLGTEEGELDAVVVPVGGGGLLSGIATHFAGTKTRVFGAEPSFQGANDAEVGLARDPPQRVTKVASSTIADGLRTPLGHLTWPIVSDRDKVEGVYSVSDEEIKGALKLVYERMRIVVEPSAVVGLAVCLYNPQFRALVGREQAGKEWNIGTVFSGGNVVLERLAEYLGA